MINNVFANVAYHDSLSMRNPRSHHVHNVIRKNVGFGQAGECGSGVQVIRDNVFVSVTCPRLRMPRIGATVELPTLLRGWERDRHPIFVGEPIRRRMPDGGSPRITRQGRRIGRNRHRHRRLVRLRSAFGLGAGLTR